MSRPAVSMLPSLGDKLHRPSGGSRRMQLNLQLCMEGKHIMKQVLYLTLSGSGGVTLTRLDLAQCSPCSWQRTTITQYFRRKQPRPFSLQVIDISALASNTRMLEHVGAGQCGHADQHQCSPTSFSLSSQSLPAFCLSLASSDSWFSKDLESLLQLQYAPDLLSAGSLTTCSACCIDE